MGTVSKRAQWMQHLSCTQAMAVGDALHDGVVDDVVPTNDTAQGAVVLLGLQQQDVLRKDVDGLLAAIPNAQRGPDHKRNGPHNVS
jgi:hypothetical protein